MAKVIGCDFRQLLAHAHRCECRPTRNARTRSNRHRFRRNSYFVINGKQVLKPSYTDALFAVEAMNLGTFYENNLPVVSYTRQSTPPSGYAFRVYHFTKDAVGFDVNIAAAKDTSDGYQSLFNPGDRLVLTLVNTQTGETVDAHTFILNGVGAVTQNSDRYLP